MLGGTFRETVDSLLNPSDVMVLRTSARLYKKLEHGVLWISSAQKKKKTSDGRTSVANEKSLVGTGRCSQTTYRCKNGMKAANMDRTAKIFFLVQSDLYESLRRKH